MRLDRLGTGVRHLARQIQGALPQGGSLNRASWERRHRVLLWLLWLHALGIATFGLVRGIEAPHSLLEASAIVPFALLGMQRTAAARVRSSAASLGLLTASALLVHLADGAIEAHFHFFVMVGVVALYQEWTPYLTAIAITVLHHGVLGTLQPETVYGTPAATRSPSAPISPSGTCT